MSNALTKSQNPTSSASLMARFATRFGVDPDKMLDTLKQTAFKQKGEKVVSNEQMMALLIVAEAYNLNPFTKEIYAFPSEQGIVPIISVDGWIRMINEHPQFESMELKYADEGSDNPWIECIIHRKDRSKAIVIREYLEECIRDTAPWQSHPRRMLRHRAIMQCGRVAFGFSGAYDPDEGERIFEAARDVTPPKNMMPQTKEPQRKAARIEDAQLASEAGATEPEKPAATSTDEYISLDQVTFLTDSLKEGKIDLRLFLAKFDLGGIERLPRAVYPRAVAWILDKGA